MTDIQGPEDHHGDMDFKIAGTKEGITALQMDVKIKGITGEILKEALERGVLAGYPLQDIEVELYDGSYHDVDSSEAAFKIAGSMALQEATKKAGLILLEPIMKVEVTAPDEFAGDVSGDLSSRRARIEKMEGRGELKVVDAKVPLAEMFGYATQLRSMTQGRGTFTMEFDHYGETPRNVADEVVAGRTAK